jgi:isoleucyl-tRNA synthetase
VYRGVTTFTNTQLSAFYSSVVKQRLYCDAVDSLSRRSAQTVLFEVLQTLLRTLAPILIHTVEEAYQACPPALRTSVVAAKLYGCCLFAACFFFVGLTLTHTHTHTPLSCSTFD